MKNEQQQDGTQSLNICEQCNPNPPLPWWDQPMNPTIKARVVIQPPKQFYPSFMAAAEAWGPCITEGLYNVAPSSDHR